MILVTTMEAHFLLVVALELRIYRTRCADVCFNLFQVCPRARVRYFELRTTLTHLSLGGSLKVTSRVDLIMVAPSRMGEKLVLSCVSDELRFCRDHRLPAIWPTIVSKFVLPCFADPRLRLTDTCTDLERLSPCL